MWEGQFLETASEAKSSAAPRTRTTQPDSTHSSAADRKAALGDRLAMINATTGDQSSAPAHRPSGAALGYRGIYLAKQLLIGNTGLGLQALLSLWAMAYWGGQPSGSKAQRMGDAPRA